MKKGEIKQILIKSANEILPEFDFLNYKNNCYYFQRIRKLDDLNIYETLHIIFTLKDKNFACSISSRLNKEYIFSNHYNNGLINPHADLKVLRHNSGALNIPDAYYFHNGQVKTTTKIVDEIFKDFKKYGIPFLDKQFLNLKSNSIIKYGFDYIDNLQIDKENLKKEVSEELKKNDFLLSSIKNPIFNELKEKLHSVGGQTKENRLKIPKLTNELLELYWTN